MSEAFAEAKAQRKPVLLYWGAKWCPPCNALKETLFKDPAFVEATKSFIAVHLDGDSKDAQFWGEKFGGVVYPEVIVLRPDQTEVTRLSGASVSSLVAVLKLAAGRTASDRELLARASTRPASLSPDEWRLLANFDWQADPRFADKAKEADLLHSLSVAAPDPAVGRRLLFLQLIVGQTGEKARLAAQQQDQLRAVLTGILSNYEETKANEEELSDNAPALIEALPDAGERARMGDRLIAALDRVADDGSISLADRLDTVSADIALSKAANNGKVTQAVLAKVRRRVAMADRAATNPISRQAVMPEAGDALAEAGDSAAGERLLRAELSRSVAPWYDMADLARIAETDKDVTTALAWSKRRLKARRGPQRGSSGRSLIRKPSCA
ncbi:MAG: thioredoxin family protein [Alphaproteobacteria bacterium]|nr:thioredoxin family protein [Alphaproteobacteria bacterium]